MEVGNAGRGIGESAPLRKCRYDVDEDRGFDVWRWSWCGEEAVAYARAAVVADPVDVARCGVGEDLGEGFEDGEADFTLVEPGHCGGLSAYAVAWEFRDEERGVRFPGFEDLWSCW